MGKKDTLRILGRGLAGILAFTYLFYESAVAAVIFSPCSLLYLRNKKKIMAECQRRKLAYEFKDGIQGISSALHAGYSIENCFSEALNDLRLIYPDGADIMQEFLQIDRQLKRNRTVEELLKDFAMRSRVNDIEEFAEVFITAKRTGGNMLKIMDDTARIINDRQEVEREIETLITGKRLEAKIMNLLPLGILFYLKVFSPSFLSPLYHNLSGVLIMSISLAVYVGAVIWSGRIVDISI